MTGWDVWNALWIIAGIAVALRIVEKENDRIESRNRRGNR